MSSFSKNILLAGFLEGKNPRVSKNESRTTGFNNVTPQKSGPSRRRTFLKKKFWCKVLF